MINKLGEWEDKSCYSPQGSWVYVLEREYIPCILRGKMYSSDNDQWFAHVEGYIHLPHYGYKLTAQSRELCQVECDRLAFDALREAFRIIGPILFTPEE